MSDGIMRELSYLVKCNVLDNNIFEMYERSCVVEIVSVKNRRVWLVVDNDCMH